MVQRPSSTQPSEALPKQVVGNVGLYYVCYRLSLRGWNVMPTSRNARGIDIIAYSQDGSRFLAVQVKALSKRNPVPLGRSPHVHGAQHIVICQGVLEEPPKCFVLGPKDLERATCDTKGQYWLQPSAYEAFENRWDRIQLGRAD